MEGSLAFPAKDFVFKTHCRRSVTQWKFCVRGGLLPIAVSAVVFEEGKMDRRGSKRLSPAQPGFAAYCGFVAILIFSRISRTVSTITSYISILQADTLPYTSCLTRGVGGGRANRTQIEADLARRNRIKTGLAHRSWTTQLARTELEPTALQSTDNQLRPRTSSYLVFRIA